MEEFELVIFPIQLPIILIRIPTVELFFLPNFKIGYAPSCTLEIYYISKVSWWEKSDITFALRLSAVAVTFYFDKSTETGWSISGVLGLSSLSDHLKRM